MIPSGKEAIGFTLELLLRPAMDASNEASKSAEKLNRANSLPPRGLWIYIFTLPLVEVCEAKPTV